MKGHERGGAPGAPQVSPPRDRRESLWERHSGRLLVLATIALSLLVLGVTIYYSVASGPGLRFGRAGEGREVPDLGEKDWEAVIQVNISVAPAFAGNTSNEARIVWTASEAFYDGATQVPLGEAAWRVVPRGMALQVIVTVDLDDGCRLEHRLEVPAWRDGDRFERVLDQRRCDEPA